MKSVSVIWSSSYHANKPFLSLSELMSYTAKNMVDRRNIDGHWREVVDIKFWLIRKL